VGSAAGVILGLQSETERNGEDLWKTCIPDGTMDFIVIIIIIIIKNDVSLLVLKAVYYKINVKATPVLKQYSIKLCSGTGP
jgi:hypothetical protein